MGLFDKKFCAVCGEKAKLLGRKKLSDGNYICEDCQDMCSQFIADFDQYDTDDIMSHLEFMKENEPLVNDFTVTRVVGSDYKLYIDDTKRRWILTADPDWRDGNPDVISFDAVLGCSVEVTEDRDEISNSYTDSDGDYQHRPPTIIYSYDFFLHVPVEHPWISEVYVQLNEESIEGADSPAHRSFERQGEELKAAFQDMMNSRLDDIAKQNEPQKAVVCPHCGATVVPGRDGRCEYCGKPVM